MGSISYIDLPLRGTNKSDGHDVLVVALAVLESNERVGDSVAAVYVNDDGDMRQCDIADLNINWRFHDGRRKWLDVDTGEELGGDEADDDSEG